MRCWWTCTGRLERRCDGWMGSGCLALCWVVLGCVGLCWVVLCWVGLHCVSNTGNLLECFDDHKQHGRPCKQTPPSTTIHKKVFDWLGQEAVRSLSTHLDSILSALLDAIRAAPDRRAARRLKKLIDALLAPGVAAASAGDVMVNAPEMSAAAAAGAAAALMTGVGVRALSEVVAGTEEAVARLVANRAMEAADQLRMALCSSDVLQVSPGDTWVQSSSAVLLHGSLTPLGSESAAAVAAAAASAAAATIAAASGTGGAQKEHSLGSPAEVAATNQPPKGAAGAKGGGSGGGGVVVSLKKLSAPCVIGWGPDLFEPLAARWGPACALAVHWLALGGGRVGYLRVRGRRMLDLCALSAADRSAPARLSDTHPLSTPPPPTTPYHTLPTRRHLYTPQQLTYKAGTHGALLLITTGDTTTSSGSGGSDPESPPGRTPAGVGGSVSPLPFMSPLGMDDDGFDGMSRSGGAGSGQGGSSGTNRALKRMTSGKPLRSRGAVSRGHADGHAA